VNRRAAIVVDPDEYLRICDIEAIGCKRLAELPELEPAKLTARFGPPLHPGHDVYGPTWGAKDDHGQVWTFFTCRGTWWIAGRGEHQPTVPNLLSTKRITQYLLLCTRG
jgi:hypothetical protein